MFRGREPGICRKSADNGRHWQIPGEVPIRLEKRTPSGRLGVWASGLVVILIPDHFGGRLLLFLLLFLESLSFLLFDVGNAPNHGRLDL